MFELDGIIQNARNKNISLDGMDGVLFLLVTNLVLASQSAFKLALVHIGGRRVTKVNIVT